MAEHAGMADRVRKVLSHDCGPFWQFVKYGVIGVLATCVQTGVFYLLASTCLKCLAADDLAVRFLGFPSVDVSDAVRGFRFEVATWIGFFFANVFCWIMNRLFVFRSGRHRWYVEFVLFCTTAAVATLIGTKLSRALISWLGLMTTFAVFIEIVVSFAVNFFVRKFVIFKG